MGDTVHEGLAGVVAGTTAISRQDGERSELTYRGYPVQDLARRRSFEEVAYLLLHGELPSAAELEDFRAEERRLRELSPTMVDVLRACHDRAHPADTLQAVLAAAGGEWEATAGEADPGAALALIAMTPTIVAHDAWRLAGDGPPPPPDPDRGLAENLLWMYHGEEPGPGAVRALEMSLILYAELGFNASTFTARAVVSTGAGLHGAVVAALSALRGPLHGGANERAWEAMRAIGDPESAGGWVRAELAAGRRVTGFGHRVFRVRDPRAAPMREALASVAADRDGARWVRMHDAMADAVASARGIPPNVDLAAGPAYHLLGFPPEAFPCLFAAGRMAGWCAHALEQRERRHIVHPLAAYTGPPTREVPA